ncbi:MAG TPA: glycosyltransferase [Caldimonas sp.]|nr:glycosyltransferase [Caldimonas sp.]
MKSLLTSSQPAAIGRLFAPPATKQPMTVHRDTTRRVLFIGEAVTLAHVARPIALARKLVDRGYRPIVATDARFAALCPAEGWDTAEIRSIPTRDFLRSLARGTPVYDLETLQRYVDDDLALLRAVRPSVVIGDFRISLAVSARLVGVPYINITNAYWSPYARPRWHAPTMPWSRHVPAVLDDLLFRLARPAAFRLHAQPMQSLARRHGLPHKGLELRRVYTDGDLTVYADSPALVPTFDRPSTHRYLGLIDWAPAVALPPWWDSPQAGASAIYVTLGSSGNVARLPLILAGLARLGCPVIVATAGAEAPASLPAHVHVADYLPGDIVARRSCLVVCNGGSPTSHQALLAGVPVLGIPDNLDQVLNMTYLKEAGVGDWLASRDISVDSIERMARRLIAEPQFRRGAETLAAAERDRDIVGPLEDAIDELCSARERNSQVSPAAS